MGGITGLARYGWQGQPIFARLNKTGLGKRCANSPKEHSQARRQCKKRA